MRFEVPQFIEIEDKIFGPFSWRQFLYLGGGVGMGVVLFLTTPIWVFILLGLPLAVLALALAFYPINNRPFSYFLEAAFNYFSKQRLYHWRRREGIVYSARRPTESHSTDYLITTNPETRPTAKSRSITSLARQLEMQALQRKE